MDTAAQSTDARGVRPAAAPVPAIPVPALRLPVAFTAPDSGPCELTWGQMEIWLAMIRQEQWLYLGGAMPLPAGVTVEDVVENLRYLMTRFPSMRTLLRFDAAGRPSQELFGSGQIVLEIYDAGQADEPGAVAEAVRSDYCTRARDWTEEWPVRMAVVRSKGALTHMIAVFCHMAADGAGAAIMLRDLAEKTTAPVTGTQQPELAAWQHSPAGQRQNAMTVRHWEKVLRSVPPRPFPTSADPRTPRYWNGDLDSHTLGPALRVIAERTQTDSSSVLLALYAIAVARVTGLNPVVVRPMASNRFRAGLDEAVCMLAQTGICALDVGGVTVDEVATRAQRAAVSVYKYAYYDPGAMAEMVDRLAAERGPEFGISCYFNDRRSEQLQAAQSAPATPGSAAADRPSGSGFSWTAWRDNPFERLFLHVEDGPAGSIGLRIGADTHCVAPADVERLTRAVESIAIEAAADPAASTGVPAAAPA